MSQSTQELGELFKDGTRLCKLVSQLERLREIEGLFPNAVKKAHRQHNIKKALDVLRRNNVSIGAIMGVTSVTTSLPVAELKSS